MLPTGEIVAHPARGTLMGNRGILHGAEGRLGAARWRHPHWIACRLDFRGRRRPIMVPGRYTELFFLDEAVALAAGHRPCAECRREDYNRFRDLWHAATGHRPGAVKMDHALHAARLVRGARRQATFRAAPETLPNGAFVTVAGQPHLVRAQRLLGFAPDGYGTSSSDPGTEVDVLTPKPTVEVLRAGYRPALHDSAYRL